MRTLWLRLRALVHRPQMDEDLDADIRAHLDLLEADFVKRGATREAARLAARRAFGGVEQMKETYRDRRGIPLLETLAQDARYALRALRQHRGFTAVALLSLALGIGATTAVFSVMNAAMLRPIVGRDVGELVVLAPQRNNERFYLFNPEFEALRARQRSLSGMFAASGRPFLRVEIRKEPPSYVAASLVSGTYFDVLGISPAAGRLLTAADDELSSEGTAACPAVISDGLWNRWFGRSREAIGSLVRLGDRDCPIVGVTPAGFIGHDPGTVLDLWLPMRPLSERRLLESQTLAWYSGVMGRLNPGVTRAQAEAELTALYRQIQSLEPPLPATMRQPPHPSELSLRVRDGSAGMGGLRRQFGESLTMMLAAVVLVLLIASINVANLLIARGAARWPELTTRMALGASRWRIARQLTTEGSVIAVAGGLLGVTLAILVTPLLASVSFATLDVSPDRRVLLAASAATMLTAFVVGLLPAIRLSVPRSPRALMLLAPRCHTKAGNDRSREAAGSQRLMRTLLLVQFALSLLLVTAAGLLLRTSVGLSAIDLGFDSSHVVLLDVGDESLGSASFNARETQETRAQRAATYRLAEERLTAIPGVQSASLSWYGLFSMNDLWTPLIDPLRPADRREARVNFVSARYFETVGMRVVRGRAFTPTDGFTAPKVAVVNEALVRERFSGRDPIGAQLTPDYPGEEDQPLTIVGVIADARYNSLRETDTGPMMWMPLQQATYRIGSVDLRVLPGTEAEVARQAPAALRSASPYLMVRRTTTLAEQVRNTASRERLLFNLSAAFGAFALILAAIGLHGTLAYSLARRRREIGVRLALGASRSSVLNLFLREAFAVAGGAAVIGIPLALVAGSSLRAFLFGVAPQDPATVGAACAALVLTVLIGASVPAIRASRVDPVMTLRSE